MFKLFAILACTLLYLVPGFNKNSNAACAFQNNLSSGYIDRGDSIEFIFGDQKIIKIGLMDIDLDKRWSEIKKVNLAGDFNGWSPNNVSFVMKQKANKIYTLAVSKKIIGLKGEVHKFKFVVNEKYWIEPPRDALNKITGSDHNTNLYLKIL